MNPLNIPFEEFLRPFFEAGEKVCLRIFDDRKTGTFKGMKLECEAGKIGSLVGTLQKHNDLYRGIYFVINYGGHEDADITRINAQFVECDDLPIEEQMEKIESFPLPPSLIVRTRKSLHTYWLVKDARVDAFRRIQKKLIAHFQGDAACVNESRVFRLPGFYHCKEEPVTVDCVRFHPEIRYTQAELEAVLPKLPDDTIVGTANLSGPKGDRRGLALALSRCLFLQHCKEHAGTLSECDWYAMITNLAVFEGGEAVIHELSNAYPGYRHGETQQKIRHFLASGTKPITCTKIAEGGFQCPNLRDNVCGCKSPAALCYKPPAVEELRSYLSACEVKQSAMEDVQTARSFIMNWLYNVEPVIAEAFIQYEIKKHFNFKGLDLKTLLSLHREIHKRYINAKETRREAMDEELPVWYEPTDKGGLRFIPGLLADFMARNISAFYGAGSFYFYEGGVYGMAEDLVAAAKSRTFMIPRYATMNAINDTVGQWRMQIRKPVREINCNPFIINVQNGLLNTLDWSFGEHSADYLSTVQISASYDVDAECPQFLEFLTGILPNDAIFLLQEIIGYLLIPINKAQKSFVFVGAPNAGKSTLLSVVQETLLGSDNVSNIPWQSLGDRFKTAELFGKLANIFADLPSKSIDDNGMFKTLTGEDFVSAERKNRDPFSFRPYARLLFSCNEIPRNYGDRSDGFFRRLIIIRFDKSIPATPTCENGSRWNETASCVGRLRASSGSWPTAISLQRRSGRERNCNDTKSKATARSPSWRNVAS
jgi:putative DNA primase/helicase